MNIGVLDNLILYNIKSMKKFFILPIQKDLYGISHKYMQNILKYAKF